MSNEDYPVNESFTITLTDLWKFSKCNVPDIESSGRCISFLPSSKWATEQRHFSCTYDSPPEAPKHLQVFVCQTLSEWNGRRRTPHYFKISLHTHKFKKMGTDLMNIKKVSETIRFKGNVESK